MPQPQNIARQPRFWAVIPAGGAGTRLWPLSRAGRPKFLLPLLGDRSLLQQTGDRLAPLAGPDRTLVVCGTAHAAAVARQLPAVPVANLVVEPAPRGSGPAIGLAAAIIARRDPGAVMGSFAADHDVRDEAAFHRAVGNAVRAAGSGWLTTIGLAPTRPETGYGYIERTGEVVAGTGGDAVYRSARFVEKPDRIRAEEYVASGRHLWNASMFIWRVDAFLAELRRLQPGLHAAVMGIASAWGTPDQETVMGKTWSTLAESTIDQGVMEHAERVAVVPAAMGWSDVGDWHGLGELLPADADGTSANAAADRVARDATGCVVWSDGARPVALVGVRDLIVVDTPDALLVADRARAQDVRHIVAALKAKGRSELT
ncbi:MAG: Mannose-1-phosphate guanylyltransferase [uncultured Thermomicrobiales bacterium]|uniref:Mannose-1-phosphate guanylyltransferase n=1 Tax=uncultured Thermomicrobiales bacterium TaxID=1645740 RepID=A0A6J4USX4_9BACT|nr:MAG: Mannose-1-phosphate guanylyltransferase [uncultured Thermomicrobiales bacterium]